MYEAHSRGSWTEALIACQPHLIVAALFATHVWRHPLMLGTAFAAIVVIALLGWRSGGTSWMYSWIGYAVLPLLVASYLSMDPVARTVSFYISGHGAPAPFWQLAVRAILYVFTLWLIASAAVAVARTGLDPALPHAAAAPGPGLVDSHRHPVGRRSCRCPAQHRVEVQQVGHGHGLLFCRPWSHHGVVRPCPAARSEGRDSHHRGDGRQRRRPEKSLGRSRACSGCSRFPFASCSFSPFPSSFAPC